ncbi:MAG: class I SAM-dependent methyltransferase [Alphaproteobacteria bacterium]|nr:class I SAM-dependent methyltransferase [Alphaproteobacteria bacterium]
MPAQTSHRMLPIATHDEGSRQKFVTSMREQLTLTMLPDNRALFHNRVMPRFVREHGAMAARAEALTRRPAGSLRLDPGLTAPRYLEAQDNHVMPGNYQTDRGPADLMAGALYDRGVYIFLKGDKGGLSDGLGILVCRFIRERFPAFRPKRILDLGCTVGNSTLPYLDHLPDAEVHAIDVSAPCLRYAHARAEALGKVVHFSQQNAEATDFADESFDLVVSHLLLHETSNAALPRGRSVRPVSLRLGYGLQPRAVHRAPARPRPAADDGGGRIQAIGLRRRERPRLCRQSG